MGEVYHKLAERPADGDVERALYHYTEALSVFTRDAYPFPWAGIQVNMGRAYYILADYYPATRYETEYKEQAHQCYRQALEVFTHDAAPFHWATLQLSIAGIYLSPFSKSGHTSQNLQQALTYLNRDETIFTLGTFPAQYRMVQQILLLSQMYSQDWESMSKPPSTSIMLKKSYCSRAPVFLATT